jgi:glucose/mannose-6-phosphate isomerase
VKQDIRLLVESVKQKIGKSPLDDVDEIKRIDKSNMLGFCVDAAKHYREAARLAERIKVDYPEPQNVIVAGMGGSAIGGELLKDYTRSTTKVPIEISREYRLPDYADKSSFVVLASYSGETEETLSAFVDALTRGCMVFCIGSGGALVKYAEKLSVPYLQVRGGMPPRAALPHMFLPLLKCMEKLGITPDFSPEFSEATELLQKVASGNAPEKPANENSAKTLAVNLNGLSPVVYGFGIYRAVALRYKQQFNENAKVPAKWETFSELNHNETMGWENPMNLAKCYAVVFLREEAETVEIRARIETTKTLMQANLSKMFEVWAQGKGNLAKMLSTILVGDFTSVYLAALRGVDPTPVKTVTLMKQRIEHNKVKEKIIDELERLSRHGQ